MDFWQDFRTNSFDEESGTQSNIICNQSYMLKALVIMLFKGNICFPSLENTSFDSPLSIVNILAVHTAMWTKSILKK